MSIYSLYIKTHQKTGLKYLGKTVRDPFKYKGSGLYWRSHLKTHGNHITTEILGQYQTEQELAKAGLFFSEKFNVVKSEEWANLVPESGIDGGSKKGRIFSNSHLQNMKKPKSESHKKNLSVAAKNTKGKRKAFSENALSNFRIAQQKILDKGKNPFQISHICPHCKKIGKGGVMKRWHFDKCKFI